MKLKKISTLALAAVFVTGLAALSIVTSQPGYADSSDDPCQGLRGKKRRKCEAENNREDRELYLAGYELAEHGKYKEALKILHKIKNQEMPTVLTYIGFATRKLGDIDGAMAYYDKSLKIAPDYSQTRSYLGQAWLQKGELKKASEQLSEIEKRCGSHCDGYASLAKAIANYKASHG